MVEGPAALAEAAAAGCAVEAVFVPEGSVRPDVPAGVPVHDLAAGVLERVATTVTPQPLLAVVRWRPLTFDEVVARRPAFVVVAAGVADPGNAGTILRIAEAAGAGAVVWTAGSVDVTNPKCVRASAGALFHVPVAAEVPLHRLRELGMALVGTSSHGGAPYDQAHLDGPLALVLGNEAHGVPADLALDALVTIPHAGRAESLNVAMAAAVLCFEVARRRRSPSR